MTSLEAPRPPSVRAGAARPPVAPPAAQNGATSSIDLRARWRLAQAREALADLEEMATHKS